MKNSIFTDIKKATPLLAACLMLISVSQLKAQVSIAPTTLFFSDQNRFSSLTVSNGGEQAQEISISTEFGYPTTQDGELVITNDSAMAQQKSMADWIKIFPQNFTLQPQQRQVVRFVARSPGDLQPGGYWSRIKIQSNPVSPPIESVDEGQVGAQINLVVNQVISAHFRTKGAETGVEVTGIDFTQVDSTQTGEIALHMEQTGNAPFLGNISLSVTNADGEIAYQTNTTNAVYTNITRTFSMDLSDIEPGQYTISGTISTKRRDISQDKLLQVDPVSFQKKIRIE